MITLEEARLNIGRKVIYNNGFDIDKGVVTSVNAKFIFVKYPKNVDSGTATNPEDLFWEDPNIVGFDEKINDTNVTCSFCTFIGYRGTCVQKEGLWWHWPSCYTKFKKEMGLGENGPEKDKPSGSKDK